MAGSTVTENRRICGFLKRIIGEGVGSVIPLTEAVYIIGRDRRCGIWFDDVNVSRHHCTLHNTYVGWTITDCGGINGTYLNGNKLKAHTPAPLEDGTVIFLGRPDSTTYGFLFLKTVDTEPSATIENDDSSEVARPIFSALETGMRGSPFKREMDPCTSGTDASKRFKTDFPVSSSVGCDTPCGEPIPGPSFLGEHSNTTDCARTMPIVPYDRLASVVRSNEPTPGTSTRTVGFRKENKHSSSKANRHAVVPRGPESFRRFFLDPSDSEEDDRFSGFVAEVYRPYLLSSSTRNCEPIAGPSFPGDRDSADGGDVSDASITSLDSLKTRIRKNKKRESQNFSRSHRSETSLEMSHTSKEESDDCSLLRSPQKVMNADKVAVAEGKEKDDLRSEKMVEFKSSCQQDTDSEDSESLLPIQPPDEICQANNTASHALNKSTENAKTVEQEITIQYLKERVLKLQKNLLEAKCELKSINLENKNQKQLLEVLKSSQGISHDQLVKVLEDELCCNICTEIFIKPTTLNCAHTFCEHCISVWKRKKKQCPMCREQITSETAIKVLDNLISKAVEYLDESYQARRSELIQTRAEEKVKRNKKPKRTASRRRRSSQIRIQRISNNFPVTSPTNPIQQTLQLSDFGRIEMVPVDDLAVYGSTSTPYTSGIEVRLSEGSDSSSVEGSGYYGGFGRCYNCGRRGHWANGCPD